VRLRLLFGEAWRSLTANISTTIAATMTVLIGMFLLGLFIALGTWVLSWSDNAKKQLLVKTYMCTEGTCEAAASRQQEVAAYTFIRRIPEVKSVEYISRDDALEIMKRRSPELVDGLVRNPLPASYEVTPTRGEDVSTVARKIEQANLAGVQKVNYAEKTARGILDLTWMIWVFFVIAVVTLAIASTLLIANTIRLSIFARRREIEVMKLVGATNWFVRGPFMLEGLLCGLAGSALAIVLLVLSKELASPLLDRVRADAEALPFLWTAAILLAAGLALGAFGSGLTLRRFLRV
jgi:cell division transport system permease protein